MNERTLEILNRVTLSTAQAAQALGVGGATLRRRVDEGHIPVSYTGRHARFRLLDILHYAAQLDEQVNQHAGNSPARPMPEALRRRWDDL